MDIFLIKIKCDSLQSVNTDVNLVVTFCGICEDITQQVGELGWSDDAMKMCVTIK